MCGIAGIIALNSNTLNAASAITNMAHAMKHRGPDDEGYLLGHLDAKPIQLAWGQDTQAIAQIPTVYQPQQHISGFNNQQASLYFAHRRLSIVDLHATGHQPMSDSSGRYWIIYNGEIYNFKELASILRQSGINFYSQCDTEVLLQAYLHWGPKVLTKLNGMFAFAIWDDQEKTVFFARDRIGIKPFFYTIQQNTFIFASDIKTIIASGLYKADVDMEGLYHAMSYGAAPRPMTCFKEIKALQAGHWLQLTPATGKIVKQQYWDVPINCEDHSLTELKAVELLDEALHRSVQYRLVSDVPVGTFLSGGIDSSTISAIAAKYHPHIKAFTLGYEGRKAHDYNEIEQAKATAGMYDMDHIVSMVKADEVLDYLDETITNFEEPFFSLSPNYIISRLVSQHDIKVVLNGLGGDELFAGYQTFHIAKYHRFFKLMYPMLKVMKLLYPRLERAMDTKYIKSTGDLHGALMNNMSSFQKNKLFIDDSVKHLRSVEKIRELYCPKEKTFSNYIEAMCYMYIKNYIGNHHVYRVDQFTMNFSIEGRFPYLDHNLVELAFQIPAALKMQGHVSKYILRQVAKNYIHPSCFAMAKKGFDLPMDYWIRNTLQCFVKEKIASLAQRNIFNANAIHKIAKNFFQRLSDNYTLWQLVGIELWLEKFIDQ